jgi:tetratricopeptide (TPR) repeat protein
LNLAAWLALGALTSTPAPEASAEPRYLTPAEMFRRMKDSPVRYDIKGWDALTNVPRDQIADQLWRPRHERIPFPTVSVSADGERAVVSYRFDPASMREVEAAEPDYKAKRFADAEKRYLTAVTLSPQNYLAWSDLGDCALDQGRGQEALTDYDRALALDPHDYRLWFYKGDALAKLGRKSEALDAYAFSLVLNPRNPILLGKLKRSGLDVLPDVVQPRGFVRKEADGVAVYADTQGAPAWGAVAVCKALWLGEPSRRAEAKVAAGAWSSFEEAECLSSLGAAYAAARAKEGFVPEPALERLARIGLEDHMLNELVVYELGSRVDPQIALRLSDDQRARMKRYVLKHVMNVRAK